MKSNTIVQDRQSLLDIALQEYGNAQAFFDIALANDVGYTDELALAKELTLPESSFKDSNLLNYYKNRNVTPVTWFTDGYVPTINNEDDNNPDPDNHECIELWDSIEW